LSISVAGRDEIALRRAGAGRKKYFSPSFGAFAFHLRVMLVQRNHPEHHRANRRRPRKADLPPDARP
jgi:hypothetical protein